MGLRWTYTFAKPTSYGAFVDRRVGRSRVGRGFAGRIRSPRLRGTWLRWTYTFAKAAWDGAFVDRRVGKGCVRRGFAGRIRWPRLLGTGLSWTDALGGDVYGHDHPSSPCQARELALEWCLQPGAPRCRCACRGITGQAPEVLAWGCCSTDRRPFAWLRARGRRAGRRPRG